jgi:hypothetical protein
MFTGFIFSLKNLEGSFTIFFFPFNQNNIQAIDPIISCLNSICLSSGSDAYRSLIHGILASSHQAQLIASHTAFCSFSGNNSIHVPISIDAGRAKTDVSVFVVPAKVLKASSHIQVGLVLY